MTQKNGECKRCPGGKCVHGCKRSVRRANIAFVLTGIMRQEDLPLCKRCYNTLYQERKQYPTYGMSKEKRAELMWQRREEAWRRQRVDREQAAKQEVCTYGLEELRKGGGLARREYQKVVWRQRAQAALILSKEYGEKAAVARALIR